MLRGITQVTVIGKDSSVRGDYGTSATSRAYYQVDDIETNDEALKIATAIFGDIGVTYADYEIEVDPTQIQYDVRDKIKVDGVYYWITQVIQSMDVITLTLDDGRTSVIDSLGKRIHVIEGNFPSGTDAQWSGGSANVGSNHTSDTDFSWAIEDINMVSDAKIDVDIGGFARASYTQETSSYLSDISIASASAACTDVTTYGTVLYLPNSSGEYCDTLAHGYQFGICSFDIDIMADASETLECLLQYSHNDGGAWEDSTHIHIFIPSAGAWYDKSLSFIFSGDDTREADSIKFRLKIYDPDAGPCNLKMVNSLVAFSRVPRHVHTVTTDYDKSNMGSPPSTVLVHINGGTEFTLTPGTPVDITSSLISGKNIISIRTPATVGNQCSVSPTIAYKVLGMS
jgi:hypothetical protein